MAGFSGKYFILWNYEHWQMRAVDKADSFEHQNVLRHRSATKIIGDRCYHVIDGIQYSYLLTIYNVFEQPR